MNTYTQYLVLLIGWSMSLSDQVAFVLKERTPYLSYSLKQKLLLHLKQLKKLKKDVIIESALQTMALLNQFDVADSIVTEWMSWMDQKQIPYWGTCALHRYVNPDLIPQPFYHVVKSKLLHNGIIVGMLHDYDGYAAVMNGKCVGFLITDDVEKRIVHAWFENDSIGTHVMERVPYAK